MSEQRSVSAVERAIADLDGKRAEIINGQREAAGQLDALRASAGELFLSGDESVIQRIRNLENEIDIRERALAALESRRARLELDMKGALISQKTVEIASKRAQRDKIVDAARPLLRQLSALEGVEYSQCALASERTRDMYWLGRYTQGTLGAENPGGVLDWMNPNEVVRDPSARELGYQVPLSRRLIDEMSALQNEILDLQRELDRELVAK